MREQAFECRRELPVLFMSVRNRFRSFEFDADRKIVAAIAPLVPGNAGMPGAFVERHVLHDFAAAPDQQMRRNLESMNVPKISVVIGAERIAKQAIDMGRTKFAGRQADAMNHDQRNIVRVGPVVVIRGRRLHGV